MGWDLAKVDLYNTMKRIYDMGGQIFYDQVPTGAVNATAAGTGTSRTSISSSYAVPSAAKEIVAISPSLTTTADAAADIKMAFADIQGANYKFQPQQVPCPVGSTVLSVGASRFTPREWWTVRAAATAGDTYDVGVTPYVANAHNMKAAMSVMYSTIRSGLRTIYSQAQSSSTAFKGAGTTSTGSLSLVGAAELYELVTITAPEGAAVAQENQILSHIMSCTALSPVQTVVYADDPPAQIAATSGDTQLPQLARHLAFGGKFTVSNPVLNYTSVLDVATSNNLNVAHVARYI